MSFKMVLFAGVLVLATSLSACTPPPPDAGASESESVASEQTPGPDNKDPKKGWVFIQDPYNYGISPEKQRIAKKCDGTMLIVSSGVDAGYSGGVGLAVVPNSAECL